MVRSHDQEVMWKGDIFSLTPTPSRPGMEKTLEMMVEGRETQWPWNVARYPESSWEQGPRSQERWVEHIPTQLRLTRDLSVSPGMSLSPGMYPCSHSKHTAFKEVGHPRVSHSSARRLTLRDVPAQGSTSVSRGGKQAASVQCPRQQVTSPDSRPAGEEVFPHLTQDFSSTWMPVQLSKSNVDPRVTSKMERVCI